MAICQQITNNDISCDNLKNAFLTIIQIDTQSPPTIFYYPPTHRRTKRPKLYPPRRNDRRLGKRILLYGSSYKTPTKPLTYPNNHCTTTPLRYSNNRQDSLISIHYQINSYIMPAHTPPPHYSDSTTDTLIYDGNLNEYDVLQNYAHTHGKYLLTDSLFKLFETSYINNRTLISIIRECNLVTSPQNLHIIRRLQLLQQYNHERTQEYYQQIITPHLTQRMTRQCDHNQQDTPSPMTILSPSSSLSLSPIFSPPITSTSTTTVQQEEPDDKENVTNVT